MLPQNRQPGFAARIRQADTAAVSSVAFVYLAHGHILFRLGGRVGALRGCREPVDRSANPHGLPFLCFAAQGGFIEPQQQETAMYTTPHLRLVKGHTSATTKTESRYPDRESVIERVRDILSRAQPAVTPASSETVQISAMALIATAQANRAGDPAPLKDLAKELPFFLTIVLQAFLADFDYCTEMKSDKAKACRILASMIDSLDLLLEGEGRPVQN